MKRLSVIKVKYAWHAEFVGASFPFVEGDQLPNHHQYCVQTQYGPTWFDKEVCEVI